VLTLTIVSRGGSDTMVKVIMCALLGALMATVTRSNELTPQTYLVASTGEHQQQQHHHQQLLNNPLAKFSHEDDAILWQIVRASADKLANQRDHHKNDDSYWSRKRLMSFRGDLGKRSDDVMIHPEDLQLLTDKRWWNSENPAGSKYRSVSSFRGDLGKRSGTLLDQNDESISGDAEVEGY